MTSIFLIYGLGAAFLYLLVCKRERSYIHSITPYFAFYFATCFLIEPLFYSSTTIYEYDVPAFAYVYGCDFAYFFGLTLSYSGFYKRSQLKDHTLTAIAARSGVLAWTLLLLSALIYLPVIIEFREYLSNPRRIYELTRTGYGQYSLMSALMLNLSVILFLFSNKKARIIFVPTVVVLCLIKGSKGALLSVLYIYVLWLVYIRGWRVGVKNFALSVVTLALLVASLFVFTSLSDKDYNVVEAISGFSDYNRNATLTVTDPIGPFYGKLSLENFAYSRIPRFLFPDKPKNYGAFYIVEHYFPENFDLDQGYAAFGAGQQIADFGSLAPLMMALFGFVNGYLLAVCMRWLRAGGGIAAFISMLYFAGVSLIPIAAAFLAIEHWLIGIVMTALLKIRLRRPTSATSATLV